MNREDLLKKAEELNKALRQSEEYRAYVAAHNQIKDHSAAEIMLDDFRKKQWDIQRRAFEGEDVEPLVEELQKLWDVVSINPYVKAVVESELIFGQLYGEVMEKVAENIEVFASETDSK